MKVNPISKGVPVVELPQEKLSRDKIYELGVKILGSPAQQVLSIAEANMHAADAAHDSGEELFSALSKPADTAGALDFRFLDDSIDDRVADVYNHIYRVGGLLQLPRALYLGYTLYRRHLVHQQATPEQKEKLKQSVNDYAVKTATTAPRMVKYTADLFVKLGAKAVGILGHLSGAAWVIGSTYHAVKAAKNLAKEEAALAVKTEEEPLIARLRMLKGKGNVEAAKVNLGMSILEVGVATTTLTLGVLLAKGVIGGLLIASVATGIPVIFGLFALLVGVAYYAYRNPHAFKAYSVKEHLQEFFSKIPIEEMERRNRLRVEAKMLDMIKDDILLE